MGEVGQGDSGAAARGLAHPPPLCSRPSSTQGALASCMAVTVTNPLEVVKIRLQLQGELIRRGNFKVVYRNLPHGMYYISKHEGA